MWVLSIGLLMFFFALEIIIEYSFNKEVASFMHTFMSCLYFTLPILFGTHGNKWRADKLISCNYDYQNTITAKNPKVAIYTWLNIATKTYRNQ